MPKNHQMAAVRETATCMKKCYGCGEIVIAGKEYFHQIKPQTADYCIACGIRKGWK